MEIDLNQNRKSLHISQNEKENKNHLVILQVYSGYSCCYNYQVQQFGKSDATHYPTLYILIFLFG